MKIFTFAILFGLITSAFADEKNGVCTVHIGTEGILLVARNSEKHQVTDDNTLGSLLNEHCLNEKGILEPILYHYTDIDYYFMDTKR
ncbi:MAG: hypothetical protein HOE90_23215 [Bacteriovoracaceae bacterium]|jgi:hypothetical protein|nr:hypothetical protein [Bacteriovoracaceae bacterium]